MHETAADLRELQRLLDASYADAGEHLRSVLKPERRMSAQQLAQLLRGAFQLQLATVTARGEPFVAPLDGLFYRGRLWIGFPPGSVRARHLRARPQVSASHTRGEDVCVIAHGSARAIDEGSPEHAGFSRYCDEVYGPLRAHFAAQYAARTEPGLTAWIEPRRLYASAPSAA